MGILRNSAGLVDRHRAARGPVRSILLFYREDPGAIRRVALDTSSRTSVALARILLRERLGRDPEYVDHPPDLGAMLETADAALLIGDPALYDTSGLPRLDLGEEWLRLTGKPFVFAFWAGRPGALEARHVERLQEALLDGLARIPVIAAAYEGGGRAALNESYLRESIAFTFGRDEQAGLAEFYRRAHALGLIPSMPELRFLP